METGKNNNSLHDGYVLHWYEIQKIIGRGGFGITYLAHDNNLDNDVAIKEFMPEDFATRNSDSTVHPKTEKQKNLYEWGLERFIKEAQTLAKFNHPNIVRVKSVFEANNTAYMIMEYAHGKDLSNIYKKRSKFTEDQFLDTFIPVIDGLALVHNAGFIHRDIKPANIYICDNDSPLLLDFGSARQSIGGKTKALTSLVTYGYAPFEQYNDGSGKQGAWTDIYSLGACIYAGITGKKPVDALQRGGSFLETGYDAYQPLSIIAKDEYSENFLLAVDNALLFKSNDRPQNILHWAEMLLGKTQAPALPENMFKPPDNENDKTVLQPASVGDFPAITAPSRGTQGLVDAYGKRTTGRTDTLIIDDRNNEINDGTIVDDKRLRTQNRETKNTGLTGSNQTSANLTSADQTSANQAGTNQTETVKSSGKPWLPIMIGSIAIVIIISLSWYYNQSEFTSDQLANTTQETQQLAQLLDSAEQAQSQKKFVTPENNNALYFYQQILKIDADNKSAKEGIENIESQLFLLAKENHVKDDLITALQYLDQVNTVNPNAKEANKLKLSIQKQIEQDKNRTAQLKELLTKADAKYSTKEYTKPKKDNAFYYYQQVLILDPNNQTAVKNVKNIEQKLYKQADKAYKNKQYKKSLDILAQLKVVNPKSKKAKSLQQTINDSQNQQAQITSLLDKAIQQKSRNRYTKPKNNNAFDSYKKVIKLEPKNKQALEGIKNIQWHYKTQFNRHITASQINKAETDINTMEKVGAPASTINKMQAKLESRKQAIRTAEATRAQQAAIAAQLAEQETAKASPSTKQLDIHQASKIVGQFKSAIENHNKDKLISLSEFKPGRKDFVDQFFTLYKQVTVKVSNFHSIPKENKVKAKIKLNDLVDTKNKKVTPGSWNNFEIVIHYNNNDTLKIYW